MSDVLAASDVVRPVVVAAVAAVAPAAAAAFFSRCLRFFFCFLVTNLANGGFGAGGCAEVEVAPSEVTPSVSRSC